MTHMNAYTISQLGRLYGLSRSTLLYYDRIGLLPPFGRTDARYRYYTEADRDRLDRICRFRQAGLSIEDIRNLLASSENSSLSVLEKRFREIDDEIRSLKSKQKLLSRMMRGLSSDHSFPEVDKTMWVEMLRAAGMDDQAMEQWHGEFEARAPQAHREFLLSLGMSEQEACEIRRWSRKGQKSDRIEDQDKKTTQYRNQPRKSK
jgi:DNA-binding transcriptional MerR regulator